MDSHGRGCHYCACGCRSGIRDSHLTTPEGLYGVIENAHSQNCALEFKASIHEVRIFGAKLPANNARLPQSRFERNLSATSNTRIMMRLSWFLSVPATTPPMPVAWATVVQAIFYNISCLLSAARISVMPKILSYHPH
jgi:hypothetical protein